MIQVGIDTMPTENNIRFGTAFSYTKGDADFDGGSADLDTYSLALYGTWLGDKGQYVDVIGRMASIKNDANARSLTGQGKAYDGKMDNTGLSLSAEAAGALLCLITSSLNRKSKPLTATLIRIASVMVIVSTSCNQRILSLLALASWRVSNVRITRAMSM